jgi:hypothetical protein
MQPITDSTSEDIDLIQLEENQINKKDNYKQQMKLNEQTFKDVSVILVVFLFAKRSISNNTNNIIFSLSVFKGITDVRFE